MPVLETDYSPSGKDRDTIISQLAIQRMETPTTFKTITTQLISKDYGLTSITHTEKTTRDQLVSFNMDNKVPHNESNMMFNTQQSPT